uniref:Secreted protein n=1 Tax=Romanomermis culicivorax TaxID=13658 RepID=A0A915IL62_ROMCU
MVKGTMAFGVVSSFGWVVRINVLMSRKLDGCLDRKADRERTSFCIIPGKATCESVRYPLSVELAGITSVNRMLWKAAMSVSASGSILAAPNESCGYNDSVL